MQKVLLFSVLLNAVWTFGQSVNMSNGTTTTCNANFYDSGGPGSNYGNNENLSHTFFPGVPGSAIEIAFTLYVSGPADQISIYDGPDNTYPMLYNGGGSLSIPNFTSSDISGALTIEFNSNGAGNQAGWVATITCCSSPQYWFEDQDGDGFGTMFGMYTYSCAQPIGYVSNADDCDDFAVMYEDFDGDGFGSTVTTGCGAYNNSDCDDNLITYADTDGDTYGDPNTFDPCGVADNTDCDDSNAGIGTGTMLTWYEDADGDGFGVFWVSIQACSQPVGYVDNADDCDDFSITYEDLDGDGFGNPAVTDPCGVWDNTDCDDNLITYADTDGDTFGDPNSVVACGVTDATDCDDTDSGIGSGTMTTYYADNDGDGFGDEWSPYTACSAPVGYVSNSLDCDDWTILYADVDGDGYGNPAVLDPCGVWDNSDCDDNLMTYADNDGDNFGDPNLLVPCGIADNTDCDDTDSGIGGGVINTYYSDNDGDGFGNPWWPFYACSQPVGYVTDSSDCDDWSIMFQDLDGDGFGNPLVQVACGAYDNSDCDDNLLTYSDNDGDNFGDPNFPAPCGVTDNTDCDDNDSGIGAGTMVAYYNDWDLDGYGNDNSPFWSCTPVAGMVSIAGDCDDFNDQINPGVIEIAGNGIDDNCDGYTDPTLGFEENKTFDFTVYPNPAHNIINIRLNDSGFQGGSIQILTVDGKLLFSNSISSWQALYEINISELSPGIYYVRIVNDKSGVHKTLIIE